MATLNTQNFATLVTNQVAAVQSRTTALIDFSIGSILRAMVESNSALALWLQGLILQVLVAARLSTATGSDVDSFVDDFGLTRIAGNAASGQLTFGRYTAISAAFIPVGATVQTADGGLSFAVVADTTNVAYDATGLGYLVAAGVSTLTVAAQCVTIGAATNAAANSISVMTTAIPGVDYVNNSAAFTGGADGEADAALKQRFSTFILGLAKGTVYGLAYAVKSMAVTVKYSLVESVDYSGAASPGTFYVVADDGTGAPSSAFLASVTNAVQSVRPLGVQGTVFATTVVTVNVNMTVATSASYSHALVAAQVATLIVANINALGQGAGLQFGDLYLWALGVAGVTGASSVTMNSLTGDAATIAPNPKVTLRAGTVTVS